MKIAIAKLISESPYSQSKHYSEDEVPKQSGESHADYERRTWRNRMHATTDGHVEIPPMAFANCLKEAARRRGDKLKGASTFNKRFEAGVMVMDPLVLPVKVADVASETLFVPSDGMRGSGKRVSKTFSRIDSWSGSVKFYIFDDVITQPVFEQTLQTAGLLVGIGRFRPERLGYYGRFRVESLKWFVNEDAFAMAT